MKKHDLIDLIKSSKTEDDEVLVHIQNECYYPIVDVVTLHGKTILVCKDIKKVEDKTNE